MLKQIVIAVAIFLFTCVVLHLLPALDADALPPGTTLASSATPGTRCAR
jgi:hypothetical protein